MLLENSWRETEPGTSLLLEGRFCRGKFVAGQIFSFSLENTELICLIILYQSCAQRQLDICLAAFLVSSGNTNENYKPLIFSSVLLSVEQHLKTITLLHSRSH